MQNLKLSKIIVSAFFVLYFVFLNQLVSEAKWWIFGVSEDEVTIKYLYLNNTSYDELGPKVTFYRETLEGGNIIFRGKATVKTGSIASVRISTNNRESWEKAKLSRDGTFEYMFRPELNKTYILLVEIMDTRGKTNDIEATRKEITVSERNMLAIVREVLENMADAYKKEDAGRFMNYVAEDFAGDSINLDRAIRKDFSIFDNIDLRFTINNIASGSKGIVASINFNRSLVSSRTGRLLSDKGITEFVFKHGDAGLKVYSMKNPLIFGLSDAANVATGVVQSSTNEQTIVVDEKSNVDKKPFDQAMKMITSDTTVSSGTFTLRMTNSGFPLFIRVTQGFLFDDGRVTTGIPPAYGGTFNDYDVALEINLLVFNTGVLGADLGINNINNITEAPATGYTINGFLVPGNIGRAYALRLASGRYALLEVVSWAEVIPGSEWRGSFKYKYQPDGSRRF